MTSRVKNLLALLKSVEYKKLRYEKEIVPAAAEATTPPFLFDAAVLKAAYDTEDLHLFQGERIGFNRGNSTYYMDVDDNGNKYVHWKPGNNVPDYETVLTRGMDAVAADIEARLADCTTDQEEFLKAALTTVRDSLALADRQAAVAKAQGNEELFRALCRVPHGPATTLLEACVFLKFIAFTLRCNRNTHITLGRFDKYMRPYYEADLAAGKTREDALETIEEFFVSMNFDPDIYMGVQLGDNGQSLVLGGCGSFDDFSRLCMEASLELNLIDPKINLRVDKNTPDELYEFGTLMTKQGMGFPQYSNDDVVIPGLIALGYAPEDAADYAVAACWEFIVPGKGIDVPNALTMNFPKVLTRTVANHLLAAETFDDFLKAYQADIATECVEMMRSMDDYRLLPSPYLSVYVRGCVESGRDVSQYGAIYNNYGAHGAGIATAADSLAALREVIFEKKEYTKETLLDALEKDYEGYGELRNRLLACPKMGNNDERVDGLAHEIMDTFSENFNGKPNTAGGVFRAGTGSAQGYIKKSRDVGATPDGRHAGAPYGSSFSPSLEARLQGPLSCVKSFTGYDLKKVINGGPLTLEIHDTVFRNESGIKKVAQLVKAFVWLGGHQLQLNCINREVLLDALEHPEDHKNLIVRVWGWSGYFNELDMPYKQHIIKRNEFTM